MTYSIISYVLSSITITCILFNIKFIKLNIRNCIILFILTFVLMCTLMMFSEILGFPIASLSIVIYLCFIKKQISINILTTFITMLIYFVMDGISAYLFMNMMKISLQQLISSLSIFIAYQIFFLALAFFTSFLIGKLTLRLGIISSLKNTNKKFKLVLFINIIVVTVVLYIFSMINKIIGTNKTVFTITVYMFIIYFITSLIILLFYNSYIKREIDLENKSRELLQLKEYTDMIEIMNTEIRRFKHDYVNIISTINGYIELQDIDGLKEYFDHYIIPLNENITNQNIRVDCLKYIKVIPLKGLLSSKIVQAQSKSLNILVDIFEKIDDLSIDIMDLCRIIGILMDNAIEAAEATESKELQFGIIKKGKSIIIVIINSCSEDIPHIHEMFKDGFSTKGENRGIGLHTVKNILKNEYENVSLNTSVENAMFKQELIIRSGHIGL